MNLSKHFYFWIVIIAGFLCATPLGSPADNKDYRWDGHPFVMCFITDDGTCCNLGWAEKAREMDFRFTIAVNMGRLDPTKLSREEMIVLHDDGFEIANHTYSHGRAGVPLDCERGSLLSYFLCDFLPGAAQIYFAAEIERDSLSNFLNRPLDSISSLAYPRHMHSPEIIDALIDEGYLGARFGDNASFSYFSNGEFDTPARNSWDGGISLFRVPLAHYATVLFGDHSADPPVHFSEQEFMAATQPYIDAAVENGGIFAVYAHHYGDYDDTFGEFTYGTSGMTDIDLEWMVNLVRANGGVVWTFQEALQYYRDRSSRVEMDGDQVWVPAVSAIPKRNDLNEGLFSCPNPFNARADIIYNVVCDGRISLKIYDLRGREIIELGNGYHQVGQYRVIWNGKDSEGIEQSSGVYLVRLMSADKSFYSLATLVK